MCSFYREGNVPVMISDVSKRSGGVRPGGGEAVASSGGHVSVIWRRMDAFQL